MYTSEDALADIRAVVANDPDRIYDSGDHFCYYVQNATPSCLIGHVLARRGVPIEAMAEFDPDSDSDTAAGASEAVSWLLDDVSTEALDILDFAQEHQDRRMAWGDVLQLTEAFAQPHEDDFEWDEARGTWGRVADSVTVCYP